MWRDYSKRAFWRSVRRYLPDVRLEDMVHLGDEGPETLTPLPYDLDPRAWAGF